MRKLLSLVIGIYLMTSAAPAFAAAVIPQEQWAPLHGDVLYVDVDSNTGYLVHQNGDYLPFLVATGQRRVIRYMGMTYFAQTPQKNWVVKEKTIKPDRNMFGPDGRFFRLFSDGETRTAYGIHSNRYVDKMLADDIRYKSYGCIIVSISILDIIDATYAENENSLNVTTLLGLEKFVDEVSRREQIARASK